MGCKSFGVSQVLVGIHRIGIWGLGDALRKAAQSGLTDRQAIVDLLVAALEGDNYIPEEQFEDYRIALWREYLRYKSEDFSEFFSEVDVVVRGAPGDELERFVAMTTSVFADFELKPNVVLEPPDEGPEPQLVIGDDVVVRGSPGRPDFKAAVQKSFSDW